MEFKGTKGEWKILEYDNDLEIVSGEYPVVCSLPDKDSEYKANAKLISCSLEMWEMLGDISGALAMKGDSDFLIILDEIDALRLKATTI